MAHRYRRTDRVDELLKQEIARLIPELKDPRVGFATVMDVVCSPDLRHARVYVSVLGDDAAREEMLATLRRASGFLRARIGAEVRLRYLPELHFELDHTLEEAARLEALLNRVRPTSEEGTGADAAPADGPGAAGDGSDAAARP